MNKRFLSVVILGVLFSPPVMALDRAQSVVLYEKAQSEEALRPENEITTGQISLSRTAGESAECSAEENPRRALLARAGSRSGSRNRGGAQRAL